MALLARSRPAFARPPGPGPVRRRLADLRVAALWHGAFRLVVEEVGDPLEIDFFRIHVPVAALGSAVPDRGAVLATEQRAEPLQPDRAGAGRRGQVKQLRDGRGLLGVVTFCLARDAP